MCMAEKRFVVEVTVEHELELSESRATDAVLEALDGIEKVLFPVFVEDRNGWERIIQVVDLEIACEG